MPRATMADIARAAGVSLTTASHALSGKGRVDRATRDRVRAVADRLEFVPSRLARNLALGRSDTIGLMLRGQASMPIRELLATDWYGRIAVAASQAAVSQQRALSVMPPIESASTLAAFGLEGAIILDPVPGDPRATVLESADVPYVLIGKDPARPGAPSVAPDLDSAMRALLDHLLAQGAHHPALISPGPLAGGASDSEGAYRGWCESSDIEPVVASADISCCRTREEVIQVCRQSAVRLLQRRKSVDALVGLFENFGQAILLAAGQSGRRVPEDLLVAQDIDTVHAQLAIPPITSIDLHPEDLAAQAVEMILSQAAGAAPGQRSTVASLCKRRSTLRIELSLDSPIVTVNDQPARRPPHLRRLRA